MKKPYILVAIYAGAMIAANLSVWYFGPWISPLNSFLFIGLDLTLRDRLHDQFRGDVRVMAALVFGSSLLTYLVNPAAQHIAVASAVSFAVAGLIDWITYSSLRNKSQSVRTNGSNVAGASVDSLLFPTLAFGVFMPHIVAMQFAAKVAGGAAWAWWLARSDRK